MVKVEGRKATYFGKLNELLDEYNKMLVVHADNVGSKQMQSIRLALRGKAVVLMGKNTMIRKAMRGKIAAGNSDLERLLPSIVENVGFVFTNGELGEVKKIIAEHKVGAPAKSGAIAPCDVTVPAGNTGIEPSMTSFFQALNIATKINKGTIEIINDVKVIEEGTKVGSSEATLLAKLNIRPFSYGLILKTCYDNGVIYDAKVLDLADEDIIAIFKEGVNQMACISLAIGYPTAASVPHSIVNGLKNVAAVVAMTDYTPEQFAQVRAFLDNPDAFVSAAPSGGGGGGGGKAAAAAPVEEEEEEDDDMGFGLFD